MTLLQGLAIAPIVTPLAAGIISGIFRSSPRRGDAASVVAGLLLCAASLALFLVVRSEGILVHPLGNWPPPFGIVIVADRLASWLVLAGSLVALAAHLLAGATFLPDHRRRFGYALMHLQVLGVNWCFLTGDLFNLFVGVEVMLMASYALLTLTGAKPQVRHGVLYLTINLLSSTTFLVALALLYGMTGTLNLADVHAWVAAGHASGQPLFAVMAALLLGAFAIKAGVFPLYVWLPNAYAQAPTAITTLLAGLLTKVGIYVLMRVMTLILAPYASTLSPWVLAAGGATMLIGVLGAAAQTDIKKIFAIHIISQIGYMIFAIGLMTPLALAGTLFHVIHNMFVKCALFVSGGAVEAMTGTRQLKKLGGLARRSPGLATLFLVAAWSLAGLPPSSGFFSKLTILWAGVKQHELAWVAVGLLTSFLTLFSMMKIWRYAFWEPAHEPSQPETPLATPATLLFLGWVLVGASLLLAAGTPWFLRDARQMSEELLTPHVYVSAVLGDRYARP